MKKIITLMIAMLMSISLSSFAGTTTSMVSNALIAMAKNFLK